MQNIRAHLLRNAATDGKYTNRHRKQEYLEIPFPVCSVKAAFPCVFTTSIAFIFTFFYMTCYATHTTGSHTTPCFIGYFSNTFYTI